MLFLVRHAKAGDRLHDSADDFVRPLSKKGWAQAEALVKPLLHAGAAHTLLASPFTRCIQTLEPLGRKLGITVARDDRLAEGGAFSAVIDLFQSAADGTVMCSHGDVIPEVIAALDRRGCVIHTELFWAKASVWRLERDPHGAVINAWCTPPPN